MLVSLVTDIEEGKIGRVSVSLRERVPNHLMEVLTSSSILSMGYSKS